MLACAPSGGNRPESGDAYAEIGDFLRSKVCELPLDLPGFSFALALVGHVDLALGW